MDPIFTELGVDLTDVVTPRYIAVEGCIGVGKTTLARNLAQLFNATGIYEQPEANPFLARFYQDGKAAALATQLSFLFQRSRLLEPLHTGQPPMVVADFLIEKDALFARTTLDADEFALYQEVASRTLPQTLRPDLVIYLQAPLNVLSERIRSRAQPMEQGMSSDYLAQLNNAYTEFFHYYDAAPVLIVNAKDLNLVSNREHFKQLVEHILTIKTGRHYYNPIPAL